jgi:hypothetical protein
MATRILLPEALRRTQSNLLPVQVVIEINIT